MVPCSDGRDRLARGWPLLRVFEDAATDLVALHRLEQGLEVALAESLIALALDDLEEDRADQVGGEDLEQQAAVLVRAIGQDGERLHLLDRLAMAGHPLVE